MNHIVNFSEFSELVRNDRTIRQYSEDTKVEDTTLREIVSLVRFCASGRNAQPLAYRIVNSEEEREAIFPALAWAGYYKDWAGPEKGKRPAAYLIQCLDTRLAKDPMADPGLQLQTITLGALTLGLGCCIIKSFNKQDIIQKLSIPEHYDPLYVVSMGIPAEKARITEMPDNGDFKYFRDSDGVQCVPKRNIDDLLI